MPSSRRGTAARSMRMPVPPRSGHLRRGAGQPGRAQVLQALDESALDTSSRLASMSSLPANGSPIWTLGRIAAEPSSKIALASTDAPPMPSRPVGRAVQHGERCPAWAPRRGRARPPRSSPTHITLTSGLPVYVGSKSQLAADCRHADAVAVAAHAADHAAHQPAGGLVVGPAELERIEQRHRARAHGHDVAQDAADAGGGALVRLDGTRMVVRLELERDGETVADAHHAGVLTRTGEHVVDLRRQACAAAARELLYEQCSLHMTLNMASSSSFGCAPQARQ